MSMPRSLQKKEKKKEKTMLLSVIEEKLMVNLSFPFGLSQKGGGVGEEGGGDGGAWTLSAQLHSCSVLCHHHH